MAFQNLRRNLGSPVCDGQTLTELDRLRNHLPHLEPVMLGAASAAPCSRREPKRALVFTAYINF